MNVADRIKETTTATSTVTIALLGAVANYAPFLGPTIPVGTTDIPVCVSDNAGNWEIADYTLTSAALLTRQATIWGSSNGGAAVTFPAGTKEVFCAVPAARVMKFQRTTTAAFSTVIPLTTPGSRYMAPLTVTTPVTFTLGANSVQGALVYTSLVADGTSAITMPSGFKEWGGSMGYDNRNGIRNQLQLFYDGTDFWYSWSQAVGAVAVPSAATGVTMTGPTGGVVSTASSNFTVGVTPVGGTITGTVVVTPSDSGAGGTFAPTSVSLSSGTPSGTFTYTPASTGAKTISVTNNGSLTNPTTITYTVTAAATAPGAPTIGAATAGDGSVSVVYTAPSSNGGSAITSYTGTLYKVSDNTAAGTFTGTANPIAIPATNGIAVYAKVKATNSVGTGAESAASNSVTPAAATSTDTLVTLTNLANGLAMGSTGEYSGGGAAYTAATAGSGRAGSLKIPSGAAGRISLDWTSATNCLLTLDDTVGAQDTANVLFAMWMYTTTGVVQYSTNSGSASGTVTYKTPAAGLRYSLHRVAGGTVTIEESTDSGATWAVLYTFSTTWTGDLYPVWLGATIHQPRASGLA